MDQHFYDDDIYFESDKELSPEKEHKIRKKEVSVNKKAKKKQISSVSNHKNKYKHGIKKMQASEDLESIDKKEIGIESSIKSVDKK